VGGRWFYLLVGAVGSRTVIPTEAWVGGIAAYLIIGTVAGLTPGLRAARLSPTQALWSI
jgi:putative ABC transport system permease protein